MRSSLHVGPSLLPPLGHPLAPAEHLAAFQREGRHFLKQVANRIALRGNQYSINSRPRADAAQCEVVLRSGSLLVVLENDSQGARLQIARCEPGLPVPDEHKRVFRVADVTSAQAQQVLLQTCSQCLATTK